MTSDRLDGEIDRAVTALMAAEPSAGLRHRVMARLDEPARSTFSFGSRLAVAMAAVVLAAAVGFAVWPREPRAPATIVQTPAQLPTSAIPALPGGGANVAPAQAARVVPPALRQHAAPRRPALERAGDRPDRPATGAPAQDRIVIAALRPLDQIAFEPVAQDDISMREITIDPIRIEALRVDPLSPGAR